MFARGMKSVTLRSGNDTLTGDILPGSAQTSFALVWVHGFGSHRGGEKAEAVRRECGQRGWAFAAFDFRGHGESTGAIHSLLASSLIEDLSAIRDFLAKSNITRLGLIGSSMGGFAAAWFALRNPESVVGCVLLAPAFEFLERRWERLTPAEREEWKKTDRLRVTNDWVDVEIGYGLIQERERFRSADLAAGWRTPMLIFHGLADDVVPRRRQFGIPPASCIHWYRTAVIEGWRPPSDRLQGRDRGRGGTIFRHAAWPLTSSSK